MAKPLPTIMRQSGRKLAITTVALISVVLTACGGGGATDPVEEKSPGLYIDSVSTSERSGALNFKVVLTPARLGDVSVEFSLIGANDPIVAQAINRAIEAGLNVTPADIAVKGVDFQAPASNKLVFQAGQTQKTISIQLINDNVYEHSEYVGIQLSNAQGAAIIVDKAVGEITNDDPAPRASLALDSQSNLLEGQEVGLSVEFDRPSGVDTTVNFFFSDLQGFYGNTITVASALSDYMLFHNYNNSASVRDGHRITPLNSAMLIPAGTEILNLTLLIMDDGIVEGEESVYIGLVAYNNPDVSIDLTSGQLDPTSHVNKIADTDTVRAVRPLNDTGVVTRVSIDTSLEVANQDADYGLDASGMKGFNFTKISRTGERLSADALEWACVLDEITGMMWELKSNLNNPYLQLLDFERKALLDREIFRLLTDTQVAALNAKIQAFGLPAFSSEDIALIRGTGVYTTSLVNRLASINKKARAGAIHDFKKRFNWYLDDETRNGGHAGVQGAEDCSEACNTSFYEAELNRENYCGVGGWRLPTVNEFYSIADFGADTSALPQGYFSDVQAQSSYSGFWTADQSGFGRNEGRDVWVVGFSGSYPTASPYRKSSISNKHHIRLVSDEVPQ